MLKEMLKSIPIEDRLTVLNELTFINLISELGYREDKYWTENENDKLMIIRKMSKELANDILEEIKEWEKDGKP